MNAKCVICTVCSAEVFLSMTQMPSQLKVTLQLVTHPAGVNKIFNHFNSCDEKETAHYLPFCNVNKRNLNKPLKFD